jgi:A/G-specific adenine glycosylase
VSTSGTDELEIFRRVLERNATQLRRDLPWIGCNDPWAILVSEVMLQQTQVARVLEPWRRFLATFPTANSCADAPLAQILQLWEGLGYHRRAKALHGAARMIRDQFGGEVPRDAASLLSLPGVGHYTANAVGSFAFGERVAVLDTNVGRVLARAVANQTLGARRAQTLANELLPENGVAAHNQALLDLGAQFCRSRPLCDSCPLSDACRWNLEGGDDPAPRSASVSRPQSAFEGSDRQLRGRVLGLLRQGQVTSSRVVADVAPGENERVVRIVESLVNDGLVERKGNQLRLAMT